MSDTQHHQEHPAPPRILFCNCTYANVVPQEVKREVLAALSASGVAFDAVPDLCDMSARRDPALERYASAPAIRIAACYGRAVRWLFHAAKCPLSGQGAEVSNMREASAQEIADALLAPAHGSENVE